MCVNSAYNIKHYDVLRHGRMHMHTTWDIPSIFVSIFSFQGLETPTYTTSKMSPSPLAAGTSYSNSRRESSLSTGSSTASTATASSSTTASQAPRESSATPTQLTQLRRMSTPRVESPRLDSYRYSLINLEETLENDLDAILGK